jgi:hypothetical protein
MRTVALSVQMTVCVVTVNEPDDAATLTGRGITATGWAPSWAAPSIATIPSNFSIRFSSTFLLDDVLPGPKQ